MKRTILLLTVVGTTVLLATGVALAESVIDQEFTYDNASRMIYANQVYQAQTFTAGRTGNLEKVSVGVAPQNDPPDPLTAEIRTVDSSGKPTTDVLGTGTLSGHTMEGGLYTLAFLDISLTQSVPVTEGTQYALVLSSPGHYSWGGALPLPGKPRYDRGQAWENNVNDPSGWRLHDFGSLDFDFRTWVSDTTRPDTKIEVGPNGPTKDDTPTFNYSGSDNVTSAANLKYSYKVDTDTWSSPASDTSVTLPSLSEGNHTFYVKAIDGAGNEDDTPAEQSFTIDKTPPTVSSVTPTQTTKVPLTATISATFSEEMKPLDATNFKLQKLTGKGKTATYVDVAGVSVDSGPNNTTVTKATLTLPNNGRLDANSSYRATVTTGVTDQAGNTLAQEKVWNFKTGTK